MSSIPAPIILSPLTFNIKLSLPLTKLAGKGIYSSIFCSANIGSPAVIWPITGIEIISWLISLILSNISIVLDFVGFLRIYPNFSNLLRWDWTVEVDFNPTELQISLTEGG